MGVFTIKKKVVGLKTKENKQNPYVGSKTVNY